MGAKKRFHMFHFSSRSLFLLWPPTEMIGDHKKHTDLRNCSRLSKYCTKLASENEICSRWASFSNFKLGG